MERRPGPPFARRLKEEHAQEETLLRVAARYGLKPADVYGMTWRELELWIDGCIDRECDLMETLVRLVTIPVTQPHVKRRLKAESFLPRGVLKRDKPGKGRKVPAVAEGADVRTAARAAMRERALERAEAWWDGAEGAALRAMLRA